MITKSLRHKITQQDVATLAGVSVTTVSLVLGGKGRISPESVSRIYQAIDTLGYQRTSAPVVLPDLVGIIMPYHCSFSSGLLPALTQALQHDGKSVTLLYSDTSDAALRAASDKLLALGVCALVLCGQFSGAATLRVRTLARHIALIGLMPHLGAGTLPAIRPDNAQATQLAVENLLAQQHTAIAYLGGESNSLVRAERLGGLANALGKAGLAFNPALSLPCPATFSEASLAATQLLKQPPRPTALLCDNPTVLLAAHYVLSSGHHASKWRLFSRPLTLTGFGESDEAQKLALPLVSISMTSLAARAVECLKYQFKGETLSCDDPRLIVAGITLAAR